MSAYPPRNTQEQASRTPSAGGRFMSLRCRFRHDNVLPGRRMRRLAQRQVQAVLHLVLVALLAGLLDWSMIQSCVVVISIIIGTIRQRGGSFTQRARCLTRALFRPVSQYRIALLLVALLVSTYGWWLFMLHLHALMAAPSFL